MNATVEPTLQPWYRRLDDAINPIVVKELRQAINGRFVAATLIVFLLISLVTIMNLLLDAQVQSNFDAGRSVMMWLQGILLAISLLFLPAYAGVRMAAERSDVNVDLMFVTTIPARAIIWGKLLSSVILAVLIYSACMPFMTLTYLMRGVDLLSIVVVLAFGFALVIVAVMLGMLAASVSTNRGFRLFAVAAMLWSMGWIFGRAMLVTFNILESGVAGRIGTTDFWLQALSFALLLGSAMAALYVMTIALIRPASTNKMLPVRLTMTGIWAILGTTYIGSAFYTRSSEPLRVWMYWSAIGYGLLMLVAVCERESWGPRVARTIPRNPIKRIFAFLFYSGAAGGLVWSWLMIALTLFTVRYVGLFDPTIAPKTDVYLDTIALAMACYVYATTAVLIRRYLLSRLLKPEQTCWLAAAVATLLSFITFGDVSLRREFIFPLNPTVFMFDERALDVAFSVFGVWSLVVTFLAVPWFIKQIERFRPPAIAAFDEPPHG